MFKLMYSEKHHEIAAISLYQNKMFKNIRAAKVVTANKLTAKGVIYHIDRLHCINK